MNLFVGVTCLVLITTFSTILDRVEAICSDKPRLFLHQRSSITELDEVGNKGFISLNDVSREFLTCRASQNVEWIYEGNGEPSKLQESSSIQIKQTPSAAATTTAQTEEKSLEYCMTSRISIYPKQSDTDLAKHSGRYICQEIGNSSNSAAIHVFVGRRNAPAFLQSRKTITLSLGQDNLTDSSSFFVPCAASTPFLNASLFRKPTGSQNSMFKLISTSGSDAQPKTLKENGESSEITFDPRSGFRVKLPSSQQNLSSFHGDYKCVGKITKIASSSGGSKKHSNENGDEDFVIYSMVPAPTFRAYPPDLTVFTSTILNLTCESSEESVILKEVKVRPSSRYSDAYAYDEIEDNDGDDVNSNSVEDIVETVEKNENKLHVANYLEMNPAPGSFGEFQCLAEKDKRVLHSWQYRVLGKKEEKLSGIKFNKREGSFSCRSKSGVPGALSFVSCRTPSECRINGICLQKSEGCRGYSNFTKALCHRTNHFCGKIFYKGGTGLIRCIGDGTDEIRGYTDEANDLRLRMGFHKLKPSETAFLSLDTPLFGELQRESHDIELTEGQEVNVTLKLGHYYFLHPVQWAVKFSNGTSMHIAPGKEDLHKTKLHRTIHACLRLPIVTTTATTKNLNSSTISSHIVGINVLIPLRSSVLPSWKTITLPVKVRPVPSISPLLATAENQSESRDDLVLEQIEGSGQGAGSNIEFDTEVEGITEKIMEELLHKNPIINQSLQKNYRVNNEDEGITTFTMVNDGESIMEEVVEMQQDAGVTDSIITSQEKSQDAISSDDVAVTTERNIEQT